MNPTTGRISFLGGVAFFFSLLILFLSCSDDKTESVIAVTGVSLNKPALMLDDGAEEVLIATVLPENATNPTLTWESSDPSVASVKDGTVTALKEGSTIIKVTTDDGGFTASCEVTVTQAAIIVPVTGIELNKTTVSLGKGDSEVLTVTILPENATDQQLNWVSSSPTVATVENGKVEAVENGSTVITVTSADAGISANCTIHVSWLGRVTFKSDNTWQVDKQIWSDAVLAEGCDKEEYNGGPYMPASADQYLVDGMRNPGYGDWFSWEAVNQHKDILCPDGWRVPTKDDMITLDIAMGGDGENHSALDGSGYTPEPYLTSQWDAEYGGYCWMYEELTRDYVGDYACYWTQTESEEDRAYSLNLGTMYGYRQPQATGGKMNGYTVRCVADIE